ncbi:MAG: hypothetical protein N2690_05110 [Rhodocyclaceae bacterium]|nr:hypothetical protein [Rhodocyclaceae bacterium]
MMLSMPQLHWTAPEFDRWLQQLQAAYAGHLLSDRQPAPSVPPAVQDSGPSIMLPPMQPQLPQMPAPQLPVQQAPQPQPQPQPGSQPQPQATNDQKAKAARGIYELENEIKRLEAFLEKNKGHRKAFEYEQIEGELRDLKLIHSRALDNYKKGRYVEPWALAREAVYDGTLRELPSSLKKMGEQAIAEFKKGKEQEIQQLSLIHI